MTHEVRKTYFQRKNFLQDNIYHIYANIVNILDYYRKNSVIVKKNKGESDLSPDPLPTEWGGGEE